MTDRTRDLSYLTAPVSFEPVAACPWCDGIALSHVATRGDGLEIKRCEGCGLAFLADLPEDLSVFYDADYFTRTTTGSEEGALSGYDQYESALTPSNFRWLAMLIRSAAGPNATTLFDLGAATGTFLEIARHEGFEVCGSEMIAEGAAAARAKGLDVVAGPFRSQDWPPGAFDVVTALEVLEHVRDIRATLTELGTLVAEDGLLVFFVPNVPARIIDRYGDESIDFNKSFEHTLYFDSHSLAMICEEVFGPDSLTLIEADGTEQGQTVSYALGFVRKRPIRDRPEARLVEELRGRGIDRIPTSYEAQAIALTAAKFGWFDTASSALVRIERKGADPVGLAMTTAQVHRNRGELFDALSTLEQLRSRGFSSIDPLAGSLITEIVADFFSLVGASDTDLSSGLRDIHRRLDRLVGTEEALASSQRDAGDLHGRLNVLASDLAIVEEQRRSLGEQRRSLEEQRRSLEERLEFTEHSLALERDRAGTLERSLGASEATLTWTQEHANALATGAAMLTNESHRLRSDLDSIYSSRAWRLSTSLWAIKRLVSRDTGNQLLEQQHSPAVPAVATLPTKRTGYPVTVSVIMPVYNKGGTLKDSLDSVLNQTLQDFEVLIWDDGSPDLHTDTVLDDVAALERVTVFRSSNQGVVGARNSAIRLAQGEYIVCLDPDDRISPTYLEKAVLYLRGHPDISIVYPWQRTVGGKSERWETQDLDPSLILAANHVPVCAVFHEEVFTATGGFSPAMSDGSEDWEFWAHAAELGFRGRVIPESLFEYSYSDDPDESRDASARDMGSELSDRIRSLHPSLVGAVERPTQSAPPPGSIEIVNPALPPGTGRPVILMLPWFTVGGADRVVAALVDHWRAEDRTVVVVTTLGVGPGMDDRLDDLLDATPYVYQLPSILPHDLWYEAVGRIISALPDATLLNIGSTWLHDHALELKRDHPELRIVDQQFNDSGHLEANRNARAAIDLTITAYEGLRPRFLNDGRPSEAVESIYVGIETVEVDAHDISEVRADIGLAQDDPYVAFVGRLSEEKRPEWLLPLADVLSAEGVKMVVVGKGPLAELLGDDFDAHPGIRWVRYLRDTAPLFAGAEASVLPSKIEGIPLTVMESLSVGTPVVATAVGGLPELSDVAGLHLVDPHDQSGFIDRVLAVIGSTADREAISLPDELTLHRMLARYDELIDPSQS